MPAIVLKTDKVDYLKEVYNRLDFGGSRHQIHEVA